MSGLAEYPGYYCYDAARPSFLPYWLDDFSESACKLTSVPGNIVACLNPGSTSCSSDSLVNLNMASAAPNLDPTVSGAGVAAPGEPTNAPDTSNLTFNPTTIMWLGLAFAGVMILTRR